MQDYDRVFAEMSDVANAHRGRPCESSANVDDGGLSRADRSADIQQQFPAGTKHLDVALIDRAVNRWIKVKTSPLAGLPIPRTGVIRRADLSAAANSCAARLSRSPWARRDAIPTISYIHDMPRFRAAGKTMLYRKLERKPRERGATPKMSANDAVVVDRRGAGGTAIALLPLYAVAEVATLRTIGSCPSTSFQPSDDLDEGVFVPEPAPAFHA
jgi:hypothetical protein